MEENNNTNLHRLSDPNSLNSGPNISTGDFTYLNGNIYKGPYNIDEYGKYMSGRFKTSESKELLKIGDALNVNNKLDISVTIPPNENQSNDTNKDYIKYKVIRKYEGNVEKIIFGTINERIPEIEGQNKNKYSAQDINKANKPKLKANLKGIKYVPINYKLEGSTLSVDPGYYFIRPEKTIVSDTILSKVIDTNFSYFTDVVNDELTNVSICVIPNGETLEVMMYERNVTYNNVVTIENSNFSELINYPLGTFIKIAGNTKIAESNNNNLSIDSGDKPMPLEPNETIGSVRKLEDYTYYFINPDNNGDCIDLANLWTPEIRKKTQLIVDPVDPIVVNPPPAAGPSITNVVNACCESGSIKEVKPPTETGGGTPPGGGGEEAGGGAPPGGGGGSPGGGGGGTPPISGPSSYILYCAKTTTGTYTGFMDVIVFPANTSAEDMEKAVKKQIRELDIYKKSALVEYYIGVNPSEDRKKAFLCQELPTGKPVFTAYVSLCLNNSQIINRIVRFSYENQADLDKKTKKLEDDIIKEIGYPAAINSFKYVVSDKEIETEVLNQLKKECITTPVNNWSTLYAVYCSDNKIVEKSYTNIENEIEYKKLETSIKQTYPNAIISKNKIPESSFPKCGNTFTLYYAFCQNDILYQNSLVFNELDRPTSKAKAESELRIKYPNIKNGTLKLSFSMFSNSELPSCKGDQTGGGSTGGGEPKKTNYWIIYRCHDDKSFYTDKKPISLSTIYKSELDDGYNQYDYYIVKTLIVVELDYKPDNFIEVDIETDSNIKGCQIYYAYCTKDGIETSQESITNYDNYTNIDLEEKIRTRKIELSTKHGPIKDKHIIASKTPIPMEEYPDCSDIEGGGTEGETGTGGESTGGGGSTGGAKTKYWKIKQCWYDDEYYTDIAPLSSKTFYKNKYKNLYFSTVSTTAVELTSKPSNFVNVEKDDNVPACPIYFAYCSPYGVLQDFSWAIPNYESRNTTLRTQYKKNNPDLKDNQIIDSKKPILENDYPICSDTEGGESGEGGTTTDTYWTLTGCTSYDSPVLYTKIKPIIPKQRYRLKNNPNEYYIWNDLAPPLNSVQIDSSNNLELLVNESDCPEIKYWVLIACEGLSIDGKFTIFTSIEPDSINQIYLVAGTNAKYQYKGISDSTQGYQLDNVLYIERTRGLIKTTLYDCVSPNNVTIYRLDPCDFKTPGGSIYTTEKLTMNQIVKTNDERTYQYRGSNTSIAQSSISSISTTPITIINGVFSCPFSATDTGGSETQNTNYGTPGNTTSFESFPNISTNS